LRKLSSIVVILVVAVTFSPFAAAQDDAKRRIHHLILEKLTARPTLAGNGARAGVEGKRRR